MKNKKCPNKRLCWGYMNGGCDTCSAGAEVNRIYKRIDRLKKQNEKLTVERNAWFLTAKALKNEWIPVEERLPDPNEYDWVLGAVKTTELPEGENWYLPPHIVELRNGEWWAMGEDFPLKDLFEKVTHWMPLPELPEVKNDTRRCKETS